MRRFDEARTLILRLAHRSFDQSNTAPTLHYGEAVENETGMENCWSNVSDYWTEQDWNDAGAYYNDYDGPGMSTWKDDVWYHQDNYYDKEDDGWYEAGWQEEEEATPEEDRRREGDSGGVLQGQRKAPGFDHGLGVFHLWIQMAQHP